MRTLTFLLLASSLARTQPSAPHLVFSTVLGGDRDDYATAVATSPDGHTYLAGETLSRNFPANPILGPAPAAVNNAFVAKLAPGGNKLLWSILLGGASATRPNAIALDPDGNVWVTGRTGARDFPVLHPVQDRQTGLNIAFLVKISPEGKLLFSTYLGGERNDEANALAIDPEGAVYIAGRTNSTTFPLKDAIRSRPAGGDAFLARFTADGKLVWSTYLGGSGADEIFALAIAPDGSLLAAGETSSTDVATEGAWQDKYPGTAGFAARLSSSGDRLHWLTYIGARPGATRALSVTTDAQGNPYIAGHTTSRTFPVTERAIQPAYAGGMRDGFLLRLTPSGDAATYLTYLGGSFSGPSDPDEAATAVRVDRHGFVYVAGVTSSSDIRPERALQPGFAGVQDAWLIRLDLEGARILSSTFWGGARRDDLSAVAIGPGENVTFAGYSLSADFHLENAVQPAPGGNNDATVARFCDPWIEVRPAGLALSWTIGETLPEPQSFDVSDGCSLSGEVTHSTDAEWLRVTPDRTPAPAKFSASLSTTNLQPGYYQASITVHVPNAINGPVRIPVTLTVMEAPAPEESEFLMPTTEDPSL